MAHGAQEITSGNSLGSWPHGGRALGCWPPRALWIPRLCPVTWDHVGTQGPGCHWDSADLGDLCCLPLGLRWHLGMNCCQGPCLGPRPATAWPMLAHWNHAMLRWPHPSLALGWLAMPLAGYGSRQARPAPQGRVHLHTWEK